VEWDERQFEFLLSKVEVPHVRPHHPGLELPRAQPLLQASKHPRGGIHAGEIHPGLEQRDGDPSGPAHQLQNLPPRLGGFLYVEADV
jgi:hypothetical protein